MKYAVMAFLVTSLSTGIGALPVYWVSNATEKVKNGLMGFSAGVMLAATCFSLLLPSLEMAQERMGEKFAAGAVCAALLLGAVFLRILNHLVPHEHFSSGREGKIHPVEIKKIWLFVFAITLHNFPEGLAVGSGAGSLDPEIAFPIMFGIGLQDAPEGFVVAVALLGIGYRPGQALGVAFISGIVEAMAALLGFFATSLASQTLPWTLAFSAGAMLYVISEEIIPESHRKSHSEYATVGLMIGFAMMMFLDNALA